MIMVLIKIPITILKITEITIMIIKITICRYLNRPYRKKITGKKTHRTPTETITLRTPPQKDKRTHKRTHSNALTEINSITSAI